MAYAHIVSTQVGAFASGAVTTSPIDTTGANLLVVHISDLDASLPPTDSKGNTWTLAVSDGPPSFSPFGSIYYAVSPTVGTGHTFSVAGGTFVRVAVSAFSGAASSSVLDVTSSFDAVMIASIQPGSITPSVAGCLVYTGFGGREGTNAAGIDGGFTIVAQGLLDSGSCFGGGAAYLIQTSAAAANPTWNGGAAQDFTVATIAAFKPAAGGPPTLVVANGSHAHSADNVTLTVLGQLAPANAAHAHSAANVTLVYSGPTAYSHLVTHVQASPNGQGFTTSSVNTTGADLLVVHVIDTDATTTLADSKGNTWALARSDGQFAPFSSLYYAQNPTVGTGHTFTLTASGKFPSIIVSAFSGAATSGVLDVTNSHNTAFSLPTSVQPGSITPSVAGCLVYTGFGYKDTAAAGIDGGFSIAGQIPEPAGQASGGGSGYLIQTTAAAANPTWNAGAAINFTVATIASFKPAGLGTTLAVADGAHAHSAETPTVVIPGQLNPAAVNHTHTAENVTIVPVTPSVVTQSHFRWRNDNGSETSATWRAAQDTNVTVSLGEYVRLRVQLDTSDDVAATAYTLYYKRTTDSTWVKVPVG